MQPSATANDEREFIFTDDDFRFLAELVHRKTGIVLSDAKRNMVYSRLARRLRKLELSHFSEYCELLEADTDGELLHCVNAITTNLTSFFREQHHFAHLANEVLKPLALQASGGKRLRIWSAGCSAGAEPYSIAMTLREAIPSINQWDARILATDIDTNMLATGRKGHYEEEFISKIPPDYRKKYVEMQNDGSGEMKENLKQLITFNTLNLLESWPIKGPFDVIFCRNVVIYFDKPTQKILFNRFADILKPGGWLYIGHSESLFNVCDRFKLIGKTVYSRVS